MLDKIKQIISEIGSFTATTPAEVEQFRIKHLSKKGTIAALFDDFKNVPADQKKEIGKTLNELKTAALDKVNELKEKLCNSDQGKTGVDLTLPGDLIKLGSRHPLSIVKNEILAIFNKLGFTISEGPEIEDDWHNFSALNFPEEHPARDMQDTFFIEKNPDIVLHTHTSSVQVRDMETHSLPIRLVTPGRVFRIVKGANNNKFEDLRTHDGMAIGFYLLGGSNNHILNCDAYNNYDSVSEGGKGGNVDGFGGHINSSSVGEGKGTGNVFEGCRAWYNSDDGFDLINCFEAVKIINCWSFLNGYKPGTKEVAGDGTGFKAGGYGMAADKLPAIPSVIPQHEVRNSLAYYNRLRGFYANHHLGGIIFESNTAVNSGENYNMTNRESPLALPPTDVNGYDHMVKNNLSLVTRSGSKHIVMVNRAKSEVSNNSFDGSEEVIETDFISLEEAELMRDRKPNGDLPDVNFGKLTTDAELRFWGMGCFATGEPTDLDFGWLKKPTIVVVGSKASVVGPEAASFTKMYVIVDGEETTEFDKNSIDLSDFSGVLEVKAVIEDANGNITKSIALKFKR